MAFNKDFQDYLGKIAYQQEVKLPAPTTSEIMKSHISDNHLFECKVNDSGHVISYKKVPAENIHQYQQKEFKQKMAENGIIAISKSKIIKA